MKTKKTPYRVWKMQPAAEGGPQLAAGPFQTWDEAEEARVAIRTKKPGHYEITVCSI